MGRVVVIKTMLVHDPEAQVVRTHLSRRCYSPNDRLVYWIELCVCSLQGSQRAVSRRTSATTPCTLLILSTQNLTHIHLGAVHIMVRASAFCNMDLFSITIAGNFFHHHYSGFDHNRRKFQRHAASTSLSCFHEYDRDLHVKHK